MNSPIKAGDLCEVINGVLGAASPNIGLVVEVLSFQGEHSQHGRIWRCKAEYVERNGIREDVPGDQADFAQDWLKKIEPPGQSKSIVREAGKQLEVAYPLGYQSGDKEP